MAIGEGMMKSNVVNKNDYELYLMNVPLTLFGKKRRQFIKRELEKVHPCFGEQFSFDSRRCLRKGKVQTLIAVMDKVKVLEYKRNKASGLHLEGVRTGAMFDGHGKNIAVSLLILFVLISVFSTVASISRRKTRSEKTNVAEESYNYISEAQAVVPLTSGCKEILEDCLGKIKENDGEIKSFSVEIEDAGENDFLMINLSLHNMFPEKMFPDKSDDESLESSFSTVSYRSDEPSFDYSLKAKIGKETSSVPDKNQVSEIRSVLGGCCEIREEDFVGGMFRCDLAEKNFIELFERVSSMENISLKGISLVKNNRGFDASMLFGNGQGCDGIAQSLLDYSSLFVSEKGGKEIQGKKFPSNKRVVRRMKVSAGWEIVGRVVQKNGRTIVYYRDEENKIIGVEE